MAVTTMKHYRYGKPKFSDLIGSWISIIVLLLFSITVILLKLPIWLTAFPIILAMIWALVILAPYREQFVLHKDKISVISGKKESEFPLPSELTLVISYADVCPPFAIRTPGGNETHVLKDKYAVSILREMPLDTALETLHRNRLKKYTTSSIQTVFNDSRYIYSFVCDQSLLDELTAERSCLLIIPKTLSEKVSINRGSNVTVHIDSEC